MSCKWLVPFLFAGLIGPAVEASDLTLSIRMHSTRVVFGDPLYIEVKIINAGSAAVSAPAPSPDHGRFGFRIYDPETGLEIRREGLRGYVSEPESVTYEPGKPVKYYFSLFLPNLQEWRHPFWEHVSRGQWIIVSAYYRIGKNLVLESDRVSIGADKRDENESRVLAHWATKEVEGIVKGPLPSDFGLQFLRPLSRAQTAEIARDIPSGEIHDLLLVVLQMQDIYATPPDSRDAKNRGLIEWIRRQPDIKRRALIGNVLGVSKSHRLSSTVEALRQLEGQIAERQE
jgi:hypothetical protein